MRHRLAVINCVSVTNTSLWNIIGKLSVSITVGDFECPSTKIVSMHIAQYGWTRFSVS